MVQRDFLEQKRKLKQTLQALSEKRAYEIRSFLDILKEEKIKRLNEHIQNL